MEPLQICLDACQTLRLGCNGSLSRFYFCSSVKNALCPMLVL